MLRKSASSLMKKTFVLVGTILWAQFFLGGNVLDGASATAAEKYSFKRELPVGKYLLEQEILLSSSMSIEENNTIEQQKVRLLWKMDVQGSRENRQAVLKLDNVLFQSRVNSKSGLSFNSRDYSEAPDGLKKIYSLLQRLDVTVQFDRELNPIKTNGLNEFLQTLDSENFTSDEGCSEVLRVIKNIFTPTTLFGFFEQMFYLLPEKSVAVGESWQNETTVKIPRDEADNTTCNILWEAKLEDMKRISADRVAEIKGSGTIRVNESTETKCDLETQYNLNTGLAFSISSRSVISQTSQVMDQGKEKEKKTVILLRRSMNISKR